MAGKKEKLKGMALYRYWPRTAVIFLWGDTAWGDVWCADSDLSGGMWMLRDSPY